jgi:hypothetical protein
MGTSTFVALSASSRFGERRTSKADGKSSWSRDLKSSLWKVSKPKLFFVIGTGR